MEQADIDKLIALLRERLKTIADTDWRDRDPDGQLEKLKDVSQAIFAEHARLKGTLHPRLEHFMSGCSYDKALAFLENASANSE